MQLVVDNAAGELLPGSFATVRFDAPGSTAGLGVPPGALMVGKDGVQVATVDSQGLVRLKAVTVARELGRMVELVDGLSPGERLIESPPDGLSNGDPVRIAVEPTKATP